MFHLNGFFPLDLQAIQSRFIEHLINSYSILFVENNLCETYFIDISVDLYQMKSICLGQMTKTPEKTHARQQQQKLQKTERSYKCSEKNWAMWKQGLGTYKKKTM